MARLTLGSVIPITFNLEKVTGVGRDPTNAIQITDDSLSRHHCVFEERAGKFVLRDLGSANGTYVNGERLKKERPLVDGDAITLGRTFARFQDGPTPTRPANAPVPQDPADVTHDARNQTGPIIDGFLPFNQAIKDPKRLAVAYEELRMMAELTRAVAAEREMEGLLNRVLEALFRFVRADRGAILLMTPEGKAEVRAVHRREGSILPIRASQTIVKKVIETRAPVLTADAKVDFGGGGGQEMADGGRSSVMANRISSAIAVPLLHEDDLYGVLWLDSESLAQFSNTDLELATSVGRQAAVFIANTLLSKSIEVETKNRERLSRLLSPNVAEQVIKGKVDVRQGGLHTPSCTVFNSDIRGFTRMSEGTPPEVMIDILNEYFERMVEIVFRFEGTLDKFMGDGLMALWGVPVVHGDDPARSVRCALAMMEELAYFNRDRAKRGIPPFDIGIGIHTGPLVAGYVGSSRALSYTVIGDTANTSARLCGAANSGQIIVTEATVDLLAGEFVMEPLPAVQLKGKERPVNIFNVKRRA